MGPKKLNVAATWLGHNRTGCVAVVFPSSTMSALLAASRTSLRASKAPMMALRRSVHIENTVDNVCML